MVIDVTHVFNVAVLALFPVATLYAVRRLGPSAGVRIAMVGGSILLPSYGGTVDVPYLTSKAAFVATVVFLVAVLSDTQRWMRMRPHAIDLVAMVLCIQPFGTALANDMSSYEGGAAIVARVTVWLFPYLLGRVYLGRPRELGSYAVSLVGAALVYVPLCWWGIRMSPQLHYKVYGYSVGSFLQTVRFGGYRPTVFMTHGLMVGMFMATGALIAYWLWRTRAVAFVWRIPIAWCTLLLVGTTVALKSTGAIILLIIGIAVLEGTRALRGPWLVLVLALAPFVFSAARISGWDGRELLHATEHLGSERARSVEFRMANENMLIAKALQRPMLGWGRFGRSRLYDEEGNDVVVTDSLWIGTLGTSGFVGLLSLELVLLLPVLLLVRRHPSGQWKLPGIAPAAALAISVLLWITDSLLNGMVSPLFVAMAGGLATFAGAPSAAPAARTARRKSGSPPRHPGTHRPHQPRTEATGRG